MKKYQFVYELWVSYSFIIIVDKIIVEDMNFYSVAETVIFDSLTYLYYLQRLIEFYYITNKYKI